MVRVLVEKRRRSEAFFLLGSLVVFLCLPSFVSAQKLPGFSGQKGSEVSTSVQLALPATTKEVDAEISQAESRLSDLRGRMNAAVAADAEKTGLEVATPEELKERERLIGRLVTVADTRAQSLRDLKEIRVMARDHTAEMRGWHGFTEKPPFPIAFLDGLRDAILGQKLDIRTLELRHAVAKSQLQEFTSGLKKTRAELRLAEENLGKSLGSPAEARQRWLLELARLRNDLNEAGAASAETRRLVVDEALKDKREYLRFVERKLEIAEKSSPLSQADFTQKIQELVNQRKSFDRELDTAIRADGEAREKLRKERDALEEELAKIRPGETPTAKQMLRMQDQQSIIDAQQVVVDTASSRIAVLRGALQLVDMSQSTWEDRYWLAKNRDLTEIRSKLKRAEQNLATILIWKEAVDSRLTGQLTLFTGLRDKLDQPGLTEAERQAARLSLRAYEDRQKVLLKIAEALGRTERLVSRLCDELRERQETASAYSRLKEAFDALSSFSKKIWNTELYVAEETVIVDDRKIVRPIGVTVGKVLQALIILIVGTWVAKRLMRRVRWVVIRRFKKDESTAQQISTVTFLILFIGVLVVSLISVNIPLAVFAFLGGALAIGIGFGAQNIINNFISSLILLFDRSIKAGDVIEVDGQAGRVVSVGLRSSHIMGFDGVELLVPNGQFLQQKVTNWTLSVTIRRYSISVGVAYGSPTQEVSRLISKAVEDSPLVLKDPAPVVLFEDFADSALKFSVYFWLDLFSTVENRVVLSNLRHHIVDILDGAGIAIAFPQRDIHFDSAKPIEIKMVTERREG